MKIMKDNKKGFTLVELLAVIVILALIMSIAVVSMSSVMDSARRGTMKETAAQIIAGVRQQLTLNNATYNDTSKGRNYENGVYYFFNMELLEKGGTEAPLGGTYAIIANRDANPSTVKAGTTTVATSKVGTALYQVTNVSAAPTATSGITCTNSGAANKAKESFVYVKKSGTQLVYQICLLAGNGNYYIKNATEAQLLDNDSDDSSYIVNAA